MAQSNLKVSIGGVDCSVDYAGAQGTFIGLDQVNMRLQANLAGRDEVDVSLSAESQPINPVKINIK